MTIGEKIKEIRASRYLTLNEFARLVGVHKNTLINYESNKRSPDVAFILKVHALYGIEPNKFLGVSEMPYNRTVLIDVATQLGHIALSSGITPRLALVQALAYEKAINTDAEERQIAKDLVDLLSLIEAAPFVQKGHGRSQDDRKRTGSH